MPRVSFELIGDERFLAGIAALGDGTTRERFLTQSALLIEGRAKANVSGRVLRVRTGGGRARITHDLAGLPDSFAVGSPDVYMKAHETGATITPRRARLLAIPLDAAKTANGVARFSPRQAPYDDTFWRRSRRGSLILFARTGKRLVPLFVGKTSVHLPQRPWLRPAFDEGIPEMEALLVKTLEERLAQA